MCLGDSQEFSVGDTVTGQVRKIISDECALVLARWGQLTLRTLQMTTAMILSATQQLTPLSSVFIRSFWLWSFVLIC